jgi:hypothetical protein
MAKMKWTGAELNRRHTAFQAVALPTELPVRLYIIFFETLEVLGNRNSTL